jgi:hypothetical protein
VSSVVSFFRPRPPGQDWSAADIAELYRIEHALLQSGLSIQSDRGRTDEGDPWFVFCRADGEVLVHIACIDNEYQLHSVGLAHPLRGRRFSDLSKRFVDQIPLHINVQRTNGPELFVHPAAVLPILIGTIFMAYNDVSLMSPASSNDGAAGQLADRVAPKQTLQAVIDAYFESFLKVARAEFATIEAAYLSAITTIAAAAVGTVATGAELVQALDVASTDGAPIGDLSVAGSSAATLATNAPDDDGAVTHPHQDHSHPEGAVAAENADGGSPPTPVHVAAATEPPAFEAPSAPRAAVKPVDAVEHGPEASPVEFAVGSSPTAFVETHLPPAAPAIQAALPASGTVLVSTVHDSSVTTEQLLQNVLKFNFIDFPAASAALEKSVSSAPSPHGLVHDLAASGLPRFDASAQEMLTGFLRANPGYQVFFDHHNVIVYDGQYDPGLTRPVSVQVFEVDPGATIAIVGHVHQLSHI